MGDFKFYVWLKLLAWFASGMIAQVEASALLDITGSFKVHAVRDADLGTEIPTASLNPWTFTVMFFRLIVWQELIFQYLQPWGQLFGYLLAVMASWSAAAYVRPNIGGFGSLVGAFRRLRGG